MCIELSFIPQATNAEPEQEVNCRWNIYRTIKLNKNGTWAFLFKCATSLMEPGNIYNSIRQN
jgi:hypothetical protein